MKLTPKDDKAVHSQSLALSIHSEEDLFVEIALMLKFEILEVLPFFK